MPRANRYFLPNHVWHITHRCHKKEFFIVDDYIQEGMKREEVWTKAVAAGSAEFVEEIKEGRKQAFVGNI